MDFALIIHFKSYSMCQIYVRMHKAQSLVLDNIVVDRTLITVLVLKLPSFSVLFFMPAVQIIFFEVAINRHKVNIIDAERCITPGKLRNNHSVQAESIAWSMEWRAIRKSFAGAGRQNT